MKKKWLIATYKSKEVKKAEFNLHNQNFCYYSPKIRVKNTNSSYGEIPLFPGYIFVNTSLEKYTALKYTIGIKDIIKFGEKISYISNEEIRSMRMVEQNSKKNPIDLQIQIGKKVHISQGSLKGNMVKICSLPSKERVDVLLTFLGSIRRVNVSVKDLAY